MPESRGSTIHHGRASRRTRVVNRLISSRGSSGSGLPCGATGIHLPRRRTKAGPPTRSRCCRSRSDRPQFQATRAASHQRVRVPDLLIGHAESGPVRRSFVRHVERGHQHAPFIGRASAPGSRSPPASAERPTPSSHRLQAARKLLCYGPPRSDGSPDAERRGARTRPGTAASGRPRVVLPCTRDVCSPASHSAILAPASLWKKPHISYHLLMTSRTVLVLTKSSRPKTVPPTSPIARIGGEVSGLLPGTRPTSCRAPLATSPRILSTRSPTAPPVARVCRPGE